MKLTLEKHPNFSRITHCFQKIEALAHDNGVNVDELIGDKFLSDQNIDFSQGENFEISKYRSDIFKKSGWEIIR